MSTAPLPTMYYTGQCCQFYDNTTDGTTMKYTLLSALETETDRRTDGYSETLIPNKTTRGDLKDDRDSVCVFHCNHSDRLYSTAVIPNIHHKTIHSHTQQPSRHHPHNTHHTPKDSVTCQKNRPTNHSATSLSEPEPPTCQVPPARKPCCVAI
jgi:hypothetical protein